MELTFNKKRVHLPVQISTWGELLECIESQHLPQGHCVARLWVNGKLEQQTLLPEMRKRAIRNIGSIEMESGELSEVIRQNLTDLQSELSHALEIAQDLGTQLSATADPDAVVQLIQTLKSIHALFSALPEELRWHRSPDTLAGLNSAIRQLNEVQESLIQTSIREILERDVTPILESCHDTVEQTRVRIG